MAPRPARTAGPWTASPSVGATRTLLYDNYYIASHRTYASYDKYLKTGPYNFGFGPTRPDWVEHFPYQNGLLISYWDTSYADNNIGEHPGDGEILPIDANPRAIYRLDGQALAGPDPALRRDRSARRRPTRSRCTTTAAELHPRSGRAAVVRRHPQLLVCRRPRYRSQDPRRRGHPEGADQAGDDVVDGRARHQPARLDGCRARIRRDALTDRPRFNRPGVPVAGPGPPIPRGTDPASRSAYSQTISKPRSPWTGSSNTSMLRTSAWRSLAGPVDQLHDGVRLTFENSLDGSVEGIGHPTRDAVSAGLAPTGVAEEDTLNDTPHQHPTANHDMEVCTLIAVDAPLFSLTARRLRAGN